MKVVIQRSRDSYVMVNQKLVGQIKKGLVLLVCLEKGDRAETIKKACDKIIKLRIFEDENGKMNKNIEQESGQILLISQFTLSWAGTKGNRPSFDASLSPEEAMPLLEEMKVLLEHHCPVESGEFGAHMQVHIQNDGPVTFHLSF